MRMVRSACRSPERATVPLASARPRLPVLPDRETMRSAPSRKVADPVSPRTTNRPAVSPMTPLASLMAPATAGRASGPETLRSTARSPSARKPPSASLSLNRRLPARPVTVRLRLAAARSTRPVAVAARGPASPFTVVVTTPLSSVPSAVAETGAMPKPDSLSRTMPVARSEKPPRNRSSDCPASVTSPETLPASPGRLTNGAAMASGSARIAARRSIVGARLPPSLTVPAPTASAVSSSARVPLA